MSYADWLAAGQPDLGPDRNPDVDVRFPDAPQPPASPEVSAFIERMAAAHKAEAKRARATAQRGATLAEAKRKAARTARHARNAQRRASLKGKAARKSHRHG